MINMGTMRGKMIKKKVIKNLKEELKLINLYGNHKITKKQR